MSAHKPEQKKERKKQMNQKREKINSNPVGIARPIGAPNSKGITLIALIITIIIMLILVGVTVSVAINGGLFGTTKQAALDTRAEAVREKVEEWKATKEMDEYTGKQTAQTLEELLNDLEDQKLLTEEERREVEETGQVTIGSKTISFKEEYEKVVGFSSDWQIDEETGTIISYIGGPIEADTVVIPNYVANENGVEIQIKTLGNGNMPIFTGQATTYIQGKKLNISGGMTQINNMAFFGCSGFTGDLIIPNSVKTIGNSTFANCNGFNGNLTIGNNVTTIGSGAFSNCRGFTKNLIIGNNVEEIGAGAFAGCTGFSETLTLPSTLITIGDSAFSGCGYTNGFERMKVGIKNIPEEFFSKYFKNNFKCKSLTFEDTVETIGDRAFSQCGFLTGDLVLPNSVTAIGVSAFNNCTKLTGDLIIPDNVTTIGDSAFYGCSGLTGDLKIPGSVTEIGESAFVGCTGMTGVLEIGAKEIPSGLFGNSKFKTLVLNDTVETIGANAFYGCSGFTGDLIIPDSVKTIGQSAFVGCSGFTGNLVIGNNVTTIGMSAFADCTGLTGDLTIPKSVITIESGAFHHCTGITGTLKIGMKDIPSVGVFQDAIKCEKLVLDDTVQTIGNNAFAGITTFTGDLTIPDSVTTIGREAFNGCTGFTGKLIIGSSVTSIGSSAFSGCYRFTSIVIKNEKGNIAGVDGAFGGCVTPTYEP